MSKRKFKQGKLVTSLDELFEHEYFIDVWCNKIFHCGWCTSWQVCMARRMIDGGRIFVAERLKNREYYSGKSDEQILEMLDDELCDYCPLPDDIKGLHCYGGEPIMCNGSHCDEAIKNWKEDEVE